MKKIIICTLIIGMAVTGYYRYGFAGESSMESSLEQSESAIGQNLDSEISSAQSQSQSDMAQMEESMDTGGQTSR